ncbi:glycosyltransferase family 1 protein [bacterium]|nr:glycosyltransferase family 1 protein [bacterium]
MRESSSVMSSGKPRIGIAGQLPPPWGGQNIAIASLWQELQRRSEVEAVFCPFRFTPAAGNVRRASFGKVLELFRVRQQLRAVARPLPLDVLLFPVGGPQTVPLLRDLFLVPWARQATRCLAVQFHAAGLADRLQRRPSALGKRVARLLGTADVAFIMAAANRTDPEVCGIRDIRIRPHQIPDNHPGTVARPRDPNLLLYVGHLGDEKGTPSLVEAMAQLPEHVHLDLVGEPIPPWSFEKFAKFAKKADVFHRVHFAGPQAPANLATFYQRASLFVFPSVAPYESFGLVLAEAMMWGLPVVSSDWRANREVLGPGPNWLYDPTDVKGLARALVGALQQKTGWEACGQANRRRYETTYRPGAGPTVIEDLVSLAKATKSGDSRK